MFNVVGKPNINIIDHINYRSTVMTGEVTADNGDGTYDVRINKAGSSYPNVEPINYDAVYMIGEIVDIIFEYGCRESPKIIGHSKKILQDPVEVEVDYSDYVPIIDIGSPAIDRVHNTMNWEGNTFIDLTNPANANGIIKKIDVWATNVNLTGLKVGIFYLVSGTNYSTRSYVDIGAVVANSKKTFNVNLTVEEGDYIGWYEPTGWLEMTNTGGMSQWYKFGDHIPCSNVTFEDNGSNFLISLYGRTD